MITRLSQRLFNLAIAGTLVAGFASLAQAHFMWLVPQPDGTTMEVYFGESADPDDPALLKYLEGMQAWSLEAGGKPSPLEVVRTEENLIAKLPAGLAEKSLVCASHDLGPTKRGDITFRLKYYAKAGPQAGSPVWQQVDCSPHLMLDLVPTLQNESVELLAQFAGKPAVGAEVTVSGPELEGFTAETKANGTAKFAVSQPGTYSIRVRYIENAAGEIEGQKYSETRHYTTLALVVPPQIPATAMNQKLDPLPEAVTSFGAAMLAGNLYTYGGHTGGAHAYSTAEQGNTLRRLNLASGKWDTLAEGPHLQGLAMVAHGDKLYRLGGFTAKNAEGEEHDLWSQATAAAYNLNTKSWTDLPPLPEPRSSFDAAVLNNTIYVAGGWQLAGEAESVWHQTAWALDLSAEQPNWKALPKPPFERRALALAAHDGKLYAIGGMGHEGGPTRKVEVFNPGNGQWTSGPELLGDDGMTGFGASAFATGGRLYVSTIHGDLQRLSADGTAWELVKKTPTARFFHRMLPLTEDRLLVVGGASMSTGKFVEVEVIEVGK